MTTRVHQLAIRTAEGVTFNLALAGPISRSLAWLVDALCIAAAARLMGALLTVVGFINPDVSRAASILLFFILNMGYAIALEWRWHGQTVGKRLMGLRVMDRRGLQLQFSQVIVRNLLRAVDSLPMLYLVGGLTTLSSRHAQRLGDIAANTIVVRETKTGLSVPEDFLEAMRYNSLRDFPHLVARLRQRTTPEEAGLALQALLRRNELTAGARVTLFTDLAAHFKKKVTFPLPAIGRISDEQFIRNLVDVLFQSERKQAGLMDS